MGSWFLWVLSLNLTFLSFAWTFIKHWGIFLRIYLHEAITGFKSEVKRNLMIRNIFFLLSFFNLIKIILKLLLGTFEVRFHLRNLDAMMYWNGLVSFRLVNRNLTQLLGQWSWCFTFSIAVLFIAVPKWWTFQELREISFKLMWINLLISPQLFRGCHFVPINVFLDFKIVFIFLVKNSLLFDLSLNEKEKTLVADVALGQIHL